MELPDLAGFAMVPGWACSRNLLTLEEIGMYVLMAQHGTFHQQSGMYEESHPAIGTLASRAGCSEATVRRLLNSLVAKGLLVKGGIRYDATGKQLPFAYRLQFGAMAAPTGINYPKKPVDKVRGRVSSLIPNQEPLLPRKTPLPPTVIHNRRARPTPARSKAGVNSQKIKKAAPTRKQPKCSSSRSPGPCPS